MATESLRVFEAALAAWNRRDIEATLADVHALGREGIELDIRFIQIYRFDEEHRLRELIGFTEDQRSEALGEAGLDG
jgi:hypothetical protein